MKTLEIEPFTVCLCGSTKNMPIFYEANFQMTLANYMVLSVGVDMRGEAARFQNLLETEKDEIKQRLDWLHRAKIRKADYIVILNVDDYIGESTTREVAYARELNKPIYWWEFPTKHAQPDEYSANRLIIRE